MTPTQLVARLRAERDAAIARAERLAALVRAMDAYAITSEEMRHAFPIVGGKRERQESAIAANDAALSRLTSARAAVDAAGDLGGAE